MNLNPEFIEHLRTEARRQTWQEAVDFDPGDGGNLDDTYAGGVADGMILQAREVLKELDQTAAAAPTAR